MADYLEAKIGNVPFKVSLADVEAGRRTVLTEFPLRDVPHSEDLGMRARVFTVDGFVLGDDWLKQADAILTVCERPGPKTLIHPVFGTVTVSLTEPVRIQYVMRERRIATFTLSCTRTASINATGQGPAPTTSAQVQNGGLVTQQQATEDLTSTPVTTATDRPAAFRAQLTYAWGVQTAQTTALLRWRRILAGLRNTISNFTSPLTDAITSIQTVIAAVDALDAELANIITDASTILLSVGTIANDIGRLATGNLIVVQAMDNFFSTVKAVAVTLPVTGLVGAVLDYFDITLEIGEDVTASLNNANAEAEARYMLVALATSYAQAMATASWEDIDSLNKYSTRFSEAVDLVATEMADSGNDASYHSLDELRRLTVEYLDSVAPTLREVDSVTLNSGPRTALALAYDLYEDPERESEILARNPTTIQNPGFLPLGEPVYVLTA